jgi:peptidoglycan hydrolase CwlO-like protein
MQGEFFQTLIGLLGGLISIILMGVGYQIKKMNEKTDSVVSGLMEVDKGLALIIRSSEYSDEKIRKNTDLIMQLEKEVDNIRRRLHDAHNRIDAISMKLQISCEKLKSFNKEITE